MVWEIAAAAGINGIASIVGAGAANNAAKDAQRAQEQAANRQIDLYERIYDDQRQLNMPFLQGGYQAMYGNSGLMNLLGHGSGPTQAAPGQGSPSAQPGQPANAFANYASGQYGLQTPAEQESDRWSSYLTANPDVMQHYANNNVANSPHLLTGGGAGADQNGDGTISPEEWAQSHYQTYGQAEGRGFGEPAQPQQVGPAPTQPVSGPNIVANGDGSYGQTSGADQTVQATPSAEGSMTQTLRQTPGYQFLQDESKRQVGNSFASRGKLLSGAAVNALNERTLGLADQTYQSAVNNQYNLAVLGQGGASSIQNAGTNFANGAGNAFAQQGQAAANGAYSRANAFNGAVNGVAGSVGWGLGAANGYFDGKKQTPSITDGWG